MNRRETIRAIQGILSRVQEREGFTTKTKLVKFLYLLDLEQYRETGQILTGFAWRFYLYGPWTEEFDEVFAEMRATGAIVVQAGTRLDLDTQFLTTADRVDLDAAISNQAVASRLRRYVDGWADRSTGELLDYVYFSTSPMEGAQPGEDLDFSLVRDEPPALFFIQSRAEGRAVVAARAAIERGMPRPEQQARGGPVEARYDEAYERIDATLSDDDDY